VQTAPVTRRSIDQLLEGVRMIVEHDLAPGGLAT
jgi:hypothetical protein